MKAVEVLTRDRLRTVPQPIKTDSYTPIMHGDIIDTILSGIDKFGGRIATESYRVAEKGEKVVGMYGVDFDDSEQRLMIGFRNSYDKSMSFGFCIGAQIIVCTNGVVSSDMNIQTKRKHTGEVDNDFVSIINNGFKDMESQFYGIKEDMKAFKEIPATIDDCSKLLGKMYLDEQDFITGLQVKVIKNEMYNSKYFRHINEDNFTLYDMYMHTTEALKKSHPSDYWDNHVKAHKLFKEYAGFDSPSLMTDAQVQMNKVWNEERLDDMLKDNFEEFLTANSQSFIN